jgi:hypothetical protein
MTIVESASASELTQGEPMPLIFNCPACSRELEAPDAALGVTGSCRFCGAEIVSPGAPGVPAVLVRPGTASQPGGFTAPSIDQPTGQLEAGAVLSEAWGYLKQYWLTLLAAFLIVGLIYSAVMLPLIWKPLIEFYRSYKPGDVFVPPPKVGWILQVLVLLLVPLGVGPMYVADRIIAREDGSLGALFQGFRYYGKFIQLAVLYQLPFWGIGLVIGGVKATSPAAGGMLALLAIPVQIFLFVAFSLAHMEVVDRGADGLSAMKTSWEVTKGHRWMILGTWLLLFVAYMAGMLACCVGILFTIGFIPLGQVLIYRHLRGLQGTPDA